jgi:ribosomal protein S18 acetylase RimI-like enzyme
MPIRLLGPDDAAAFQTLRLQALRECPSAFCSSYEEECDRPVATVAERLESAPDRAVFGAFEDSRLAGIAGLARESGRKVAHKAVLWGVYVAPEFRSRSLGRQLVTAALEHAGALPGLRQVNLGVNATNAAAIALYRSLGFAPYGYERGFMCIDGELHDEILMVHVLAQGASRDTDTALAVR